MRYLILSDLHANRHALDAVLHDADAVGYDEVIILGDLVGYGADPEAVVDRVLSLDPFAMIRGNHDKVCAGLEPSYLFNDAARASIEWTMKALPAVHLKLLAELPKGPQVVLDGIEICHGSPWDEDYYVFDGDDAWRALEFSEEPLCLFGHTHVQCAFSTIGAVAGGGSSDDSAEPTDHLALATTGKTLVNVGSVGQPRDGDPRAAYGVLDMKKRALLFRRVAYDIAGAQARITEEKLPRWLAERLEQGQ